MLLLVELMMLSLMLTMMLLLLMMMIVILIPLKQCANPMHATRCATSRAGVRHSHAKLTIENSTNQQHQSTRQLIANTCLSLFESANKTLNKHIASISLCVCAAYLCCVGVHLRYDEEEHIGHHCQQRRTQQQHVRPSHT